MLGEAVQVEHLRRSRRQERRVRRRSHLRDLLQQLDVFRPAAEFVIADQGRERSAAEDAVFFFVDLLEQRALVEFGSPLQVAQQFPLGDVENADLELVAGFALVHQVLETAPAALPASGKPDGAALR